MITIIIIFLQDSKKSEENEIEQFIQAIFTSRKKKDYMLLAVSTSFPCNSGCRRASRSPLEFLPQQEIEKRLQTLKSSMSGLDVWLITSCSVKQIIVGSEKEKQRMLTTESVE